MYLFILESIGTSELILIGIVALIVFGPRKLPQMAKTVGKMMTELRSTTNEFKETWQREASFEEESKQIRNIFSEEGEVIETQTISREVSQNTVEEKKLVPEIRQLDAEQIKEKFKTEKQTNITPENKESDKRDWL